MTVTQCEDFKISFISNNLPGELRLLHLVFQYLRDTFTSGDTFGMTTDEKCRANVQNAQHSTGPRTEAGKAAVAHNAVTHGLTAQNIVPRSEDEKAQFAAIRTEAYAECRPQGTTETLLVDRLTHARCSLVRATRLLGELETGTIEDATDPEKSKQIARLHRYVQMHERSQYRALQTLKGEQTNRGLKEASMGLTPMVGVPPRADFSKIAKFINSRPAARTQKTGEEMLQNAAAKADKIIAQEIAEHGPIPPAIRAIISDMVRRDAEQPQTEEPRA